MGKFVIKTRTDKQFYFNLKTENGQIILSYEGFATRADCKNAIDLIRIYAAEEANYERKTTANGKYYFNLKTPDGKLIGTSEIYQTFIGMDRGISSVKLHAANAGIEDE